MLRISCNCVSNRSFKLCGNDAPCTARAVYRNAYQTRYLSHLLKLPLSYFDAHPVGELMSRTETDTERVRDMFTTLGANLLVNVLTMIGIFAVTFALMPTLALIMAGISVVLLAVLIFILFEDFSAL